MLDLPDRIRLIAYGGGNLVGHAGKARHSSLEMVSLQYCRWRQG